MEAEDDLDLSEWDDVLGAEPEKKFGKEKDEKSKENVPNEDDSDEEGWGDVIAIEVLENYCSNLMKQMEIFRKQGVLCDASIVVDDRELPVHKNVLASISPFFKNIFSRITRPEDSKITLRNLTGQIMDDILHFSYTGEVCIHDGNVRQLVATANFLQLQSLKDMGITYLENKLSPANAVEILLIADKHSCQSLIQSTEKMISDNFVVVSKTEGFKKLKFEMLYQFIKSEDIRVMKEEEVYEAVIFWVKSGIGDRREKEKQLPDLLREVRFPLISPSYLNEVVKNEELFQYNKACLNILNEANHFHSPYNTNRTVLEDKLTRPRKFMGVVWGIVIVGGLVNDKPTKDVFSYVTSNFKWFPLTPMPQPRYCHSVVACDGFIYVFGGKDESTKSISSVIRFDPTSNKWENVAPLPYKVASIGSCVLGGQIYVAGGLAGIGSIDVVLKYSARNDVWQRVANLNCARGALALVADERNIFALGGIKKTGVNINAQWEFLNTMEVFYRESNTWNYGADLLSKRAHASAVSINQNIYLFGGQSELLGSCKGLDIFNTFTKEWSSSTYLGIPRSMAGIAISESKFYVIGGVTSKGQYINTAESFDVAKEQWMKIASLPNPVGSMQCCCVQLRLAVLKGMTTSLSE